MTMLKNIANFILPAVICVVFVMVAGCETEAQSDALIGSAIGAGIGALAGGDTEGALIGAAVGGGAGYIWGNEADKKKAKQTREAQAATTATALNTETVWITNSNGSKQAVRLTKQGPGYIGPRGEYYSEMPTEEQLKVLYGL